MRFGEANCYDVSTTGSGLSWEEMEEWPDWKSTGVGALTCTLPRGYDQRKPVYVDLRQNQQGLEPAYLLSYDGCPLFSSPNDRLLGRRKGGACLCDRGYYAVGWADLISVCWARRKSGSSRLGDLDLAVHTFVRPASDFPLSASDILDASPALIHVIFI